MLRNHPIFYRFILCLIFPFTYHEFFLEEYLGTKKKYWSNLIIAHRNALCKLNRKAIYLNFVLLFREYSIFPLQKIFTFNKSI